jgi:hypothetical protein
MAELIGSLLETGEWPQDITEFKRLPKEEANSCEVHRILHHQHHRTNGEDAEWQGNKEEELKEKSRLYLEEISSDSE